MAYEFLKKLFGTPKEGEAPKSMTYEELEKAIDGDKDLKLVDLSAGGYVAKEKFDAKETELKGVKQQLTDANTQIKSFKDQDIESVQKKVTEWETKYNKDTKDLKDQMAAQQRNYAENMLLSGYKFTSKAARNGILGELRAKNFQIDDKGVLLGAKDFMKGLMSDDEFKGAFVTEKPDGKEGSEGAAGANGRSRQKPPRFSEAATGGNGGEANPFLTAGMGFTRIRQPKETNN